MFARHIATHPQHPKCIGKHSGVFRFVHCARITKEHDAQAYVDILFCAHGCRGAAVCCFRRSQCEQHILRGQLGGFAGFRSAECTFQWIWILVINLLINIGFLKNSLWWEVFQRQPYRREEPYPKHFKQLCTCMFDLLFKPIVA